MRSVSAIFFIFGLLFASKANASGDIVLCSDDFDKVESKHAELKQQISTWVWGSEDRKKREEILALWLKTAPLESIEDVLGPAAETQKFISWSIPAEAVHSVSRIYEKGVEKCFIRSSSQKIFIVQLKKGENPDAVRTVRTYGG